MRIGDRVKLGKVVATVVDVSNLDNNGVIGVQRDDDTRAGVTLIERWFEDTVERIHPRGEV